MLINSLRRTNSLNEKPDSWIQNFLKIHNLPKTRDKKINTNNKFFKYQKIDIKTPKGYENITPQNSTINSNNGNNLKISSIKKINFNSQINFFPKNIFSIKKQKKGKEIIKEPIIIAKKEKNKENTNYKRGKLINIINLSKISTMYNFFENYKGNNTFLIQKPKTEKNISKKTKFNYLEEYFKEKNIINQQIKHEYKPNLNNFLINGTLREFNKKSKEMKNLKSDLNNLYKDSSVLNNIISYIGTKLYRLRKNENEKSKQIIKQMNKEKLYKKIMKLKMRKGEISQDRLFKRKNFMTEDYLIKKRIKQKLIYKNGYLSNSFKAKLNPIKIQQQIDSQNNIN